MWSSLAFEPNILHKPTNLLVAFRMPIPLARDEMVAFVLPGFQRASGSGFFLGGPAIDDDYRSVRVAYLHGVVFRGVRMGIMAV